MIEQLGQPLTALAIHQRLGIGREASLGVTREYLHDNFRYEDGKLFRKPGHKKRRLDFWEWSIRGPYRRIKIKGHQFQVHRLIWIMHNGPIPSDMVLDHINRDQLDNRIENLRCVTQRVNVMNSSQSDNPLRNMYFDKRINKWRVMCGFYGKKLHVGVFSSEEEASAVACKANELMETVE